MCPFGIFFSRWYSRVSLAKNITWGESIFLQHTNYTMCSFSGMKLWCGRQLSIGSSRENFWARRNVPDCQWDFSTPVNVQSHSLEYAAFRKVGYLLSIFVYRVVYQHILFCRLDSEACSFNVSTLHFQLRLLSGSSSLPPSSKKRYQAKRPFSEVVAKRVKINLIPP